MNIALIGAGIVGVTTAYELAADGHQVTVFERCGAVAEEASFASGGLISPTCLTPWADTHTASRVLRQWWSPLNPQHLGPHIGPRQVSWMWRWWRAGRPESQTLNRDRLLQLALYSRQRLQHLRTDLALDYEHSTGCLVMLRDAQDLARAQATQSWWREVGLPFHELSPEQTRRLEPGLNPDTTFAGALLLPEDEAGNCRQFAMLLRNEALRLGVKFEFQTSVLGLEAGQRPTLQTRSAGSQPQQRSFDACVVCAGSASADLLRPLGLKIPLLGVHGYSVSAQVREPLNTPRSAVWDAQRQVSITRLGQRVRVAGGFELGHNAQDKRSAPLRELYQVLQDWFPGAATLSSGVQEWKGSQAMLPDGPPLIGASGLPGVWLNLGHGASGWALSCGSARALADTMSGRSAAIDLSGHAMERYA